MHRCFKVLFRQNRLDFRERSWKVSAGGPAGAVRSKQHDCISNKKMLWHPSPDLKEAVKERLEHPWESFSLFSVHISVQKSLSSQSSMTVQIVCVFEH